ncbi:MAG: sensor domain-containing diguanylate cyclase [Acidimicrobiales bacterium]
MVAVLHWDGLALRVLPFAVVAVGAEASLLLPPGPASSTDAIISAALLVATVLCFFLPWSVLPSWADLIIPLLYTGSAVALILAAGGSTTGIGLVIVLPIVWTALYLRPWKSAVVVVAFVAVGVITSIYPVYMTDTVRLRRVFIYLAIGGLIAYCIVELRLRITRAIAQRDELNRRMAESIGELEERNSDAALLSSFSEMLHTCDDLDEAYGVITYACEKKFPEGGAVYLARSSGELMSFGASWGDLPSGKSPIFSNACWALRLGRFHDSSPGGPSCTHVAEWNVERHLCCPMTVHGETIGIMTFVLPRGPNGPTEGGEDHLVQFALSITEQVAIAMANFKLRETLRAMSVRDPLTNLYNRRYMEETLDRELNKEKAIRNQLSILQIDVDHFKNFNDTYGHEVGDFVLRSIGEMLLSLFRDSDVPCRSGGEEFTVVLPRCSLIDAERRAQRLQESVAELHMPFRTLENAPRPPTLSIGIATSPEHGTATGTLLRAADQALYAAKTAGRDRIVRALNATALLDDGAPEEAEARPRDGHVSGA